MNRPRLAMTVAMLATALTPTVAQSSTDATVSWPAQGVEVVVRGAASSTPRTLEVQTEIVGRGKTAKLAQRKLIDASAKARTALERLANARVRIDRTRLEPPQAKTDEQVQVVGGGIIVAGAIGGGGEPAPPRFAARQTWTIRVDGLEGESPAARLEQLTTVLDALHHAKLPIGRAPDPENPWGNMNAFIRMVPGGIGPGVNTVIEDAPPAPIRFIGNPTEAEAKATADALARAKALASRLAKAAGRNIGKPVSVQVMWSLPPVPGLARTADHAVELKVVFALR